MTAKRIETMIVDFDSNVNGQTFEGILLALHATFAKQRKTDRRDIELSLIAPYDNINGDFIVGVIITTKRGGLPPKHNPETGETSSLGLNQDEGLGYANIFLYEKRRNLLLYEFNKNGTYLNQFVEYVRLKGQEYLNSDPDSDSFHLISLGINPLLRTEAYQRMLDIGIYRKLEIDIANPNEFMEYVDHDSIQGQSLLELTRTARALRSPTFKMKFSCGHLMSSQLNPNVLLNIVQAIRYGLGTRHGADIKTLKIEGYYTDPEGRNVLQPIDLLADRYIKFINLPEPREFTDFQEGQRREEIVSLYISCLNELSRLI